MSQEDDKRPEGGEPVVEVDTPVTTVIVQRPRKDAVAQYEDWLKEITPVAQQFAGHRGVNVIRPHGATQDYTIVLHFDSIANLRNWLDSEVRARLAEKIRPFLRAEESIEIKTGLEFWFTPTTASKSAPAYKQFLVTLSAIFPLSVAVPWLLAPLFQWLPELGTLGIRQLIVAAVIVATMTYLVMPRYTRLVSRWLYSEKRKNP